MYRFRFATRCFLAIFTTMAATSSLCAEAPGGFASYTTEPHLQTLEPPGAGDRIWLISTRHLPSRTGCLDLQSPQLAVHRLDPCGRSRPSSLNEYFQFVSSLSIATIYVHGYRFDPCEAISRGLFVYRNTAARCCPDPVDWVIWSWQSERDGWIGSDVREKAKYTDAQGLYLAWLLREHHYRGVPTAMIGYSFGGRVVTGSLHALAGGPLGRQVLNGPPVTDARVDVALIAPAIENDWLTEGHYHGRATNNIDQLLVMYNRQDVVLRRYWLLGRVRGAVALGLGGLSALARLDASDIVVQTRDYSRWIGPTHDEVDYYQKNPSTGAEIAQLIQDAPLVHRRRNDAIDQLQ